MKGLYRKFNLFCLRNRNKGIPNLMFYIAVGTAFVYITTLLDPNYTLYKWIYFDKDLILQGQIWRLITPIFIIRLDSDALGHVLRLVFLFFFYRMGIMLEQRIGTLKFNLFYFSGVLLLDVAGMILGSPYHLLAQSLNPRLSMDLLDLVFPGLYVSGDALKFSLLLAFATVYSDTSFLLMYIVPLRAKYLAWAYLLFVALQSILLLSPLPLIYLTSYVLFFWPEISNLLPDRFRNRQQRKRQNQFYRAQQKPQSRQKQKPNPNWAEGYQSKTGQKPYRHKCTVCGRTDTEHPNLEFRYCSRCEGYHCYCLDHINDHPHITE